MRLGPPVNRHDIHQIVVIQVPSPELVRIRGTGMTGGIQHLRGQGAIDLLEKDPYGIGIGYHHVISAIVIEVGDIDRIAIAGRILHRTGQPASAVRRKTKS